MAVRSEISVRTIRAAVLRRRGAPLRIESLLMEGPRPDEVLVRIAASGICHTDIAMRDEWEDADGPVVLGHEGAGVVEQVGWKVGSVKRGDHVVLSYQSCGRCAACRRGRPMDCRRLSDLNFGFQRLDGSNALARSGVRGHFFGQSSFATHSLATERNLVKVPKSLPLELVAPLGCGIQTGAGTVMNVLKPPAGASIAIIGVGTVGLAAVMAARLAGAGPIIGVDIRANRLKLAKELGATHAIRPPRQEIASCVKAITGGGVDYVLEITGRPELLRLAIDLLNPRGTVAIFSGERAPDSLGGGRRGVSIVEGDSVPQQFIPKLIALHRTGCFPFDRLIRYYEFRQINRAIADAKRGVAIKPVLRMRGLKGDPARET